VLERKVPKEYHDYTNVFSAGEAKVLPPHRTYNHKIKTIDNQEPPFGKIYNMSTNELEALKSYIDEMLGKGFIQSSNSPAGTLVLFVKKKNGMLRLLAASISKGPLAIGQYLNNGCTNSLQLNCYLEKNKKRKFLSKNKLYIDILILVELLVL
jgi:hypothetical protein